MKNCDCADRSTASLFFGIRVIILATAAVLLITARSPSHTTTILLREDGSQITVVDGVRFMYTPPPARPAPSECASEVDCQVPAHKKVDLRDDGPLEPCPHPGENVINRNLSGVEPWLYSGHPR